MSAPDLPSVDPAEGVDQVAAAESPPDRDVGDNDTGLPLVLTVDEVAALLRVDRKSIYELIARRQLPGVQRVGRVIRVHRDAVLQWLRDGQGRLSRSAGRKAMR